MMQRRRGSNETDYNFFFSQFPWLSAKSARNADASGHQGNLGMQSIRAGMRRASPFNWLLMTWQRVRHYTAGHHDYGRCHFRCLMEDITDKGAESIWNGKLVMGRTVSFFISSKTEYSPTSAVEKVEVDFF